MSSRKPLALLAVVVLSTVLADTESKVWLKSVDGALLFGPQRDVNLTRWVVVRVLLFRVVVLLL